MRGEGGPFAQALQREQDWGGGAVLCVTVQDGAAVAC